MERKCKDCKHFNSRWKLIFRLYPKFIRHICVRPNNNNKSVFDFFESGFSYCINERVRIFNHFDNICGEVGKYFEPKKPVQDQYELNYKKPVSYL